jgi:SnoaL-like domain
MHKQSESVTTLPRIILDYFAAANDGRINAAAACFGENARVHDENHDHVGHAAIREWVADTTQQFEPKTELLRAIENNGTFVATARVSGNFPGSPAELEFTFTLADEKISNLSIQ